MAICSSCGNQLADTSRFCTACGQPVIQPIAPATAKTVPAAPLSARTCPSCGAMPDPSSAFCTICGTRISQASAPPETTQPAREPDIQATSAVAVAPALSPAESGVESAPAAQPATPEPTYTPAPPGVPAYPAHDAYTQQQSSGGKFRAVILILLVVIAVAGSGAWYFMGVETVVVCSPPDVTVFLDDQAIAPASYGRYVIPHLSRKPHLLKVQSPGYADTVQQLDFPLTSLQEWINIKLVPSQPQRP